MLSKPAAVVLTLFTLAAAPAALARGTVTIDSGLMARLQGGPASFATPTAVVRKDRMRSCQVGASRSRAPGATETQRKASTVACEQPPRSNLNLSGGLKGAEAAAIAAAG